MLDISLLPRIAALKEAFEKQKKALEGFYSKSVIEKACFQYAQVAIRQNPRVMISTPEALAFYRHLADPVHLKAIIFEQEKQRLIKEMPEHRDFIERFRLSRLKNGYTPGVLAEHLHRKGLIAPKQEPPVLPSAAPKKVRFA